TREWRIRSAIRRRKFQPREARGTLRGLPRAGPGFSARRECTMMKRSLQLGRYWHTLRHLRPVQIGGRLVHRLHRPSSPAVLALPPRQATGPFVAPAARAPSMSGPETFRFLNEERSVTTAADWDRPDVPMLWRYNLHYFDDLSSERALERADWHSTLVDHWLRDNPAPRGTGWDPYPTSLRIVNWIK